MEGNHRATIECDGVKITATGGELDIMRMCELFADLLLALGYRFKEGWNICYGPEDNGLEGE